MLVEKLERVGVSAGRGRSQTNTKEGREVGVEA